MPVVYRRRLSVRFEVLERSDRHFDGGQLVSSHSYQHRYAPVFFPGHEDIFQSTNLVSQILNESFYPFEDHGLKSLSRQFWSEQLKTSNQADTCQPKVCLLRANRRKTWIPRKNAFFNGFHHRRKVVCVQYSSPSF